MHKRLKHIGSGPGRRGVLLFVLFSSMLLLAITIFQISKADIQAANTESLRTHFQVMATGNVLLIGTAMFLILCVFYLLVLENRRQRRMISKLRMQEEHMRIIISNIGEGLIATDRKGEITYMNPAAEQLTGWSRGGSQESTS